MLIQLDESISDLRAVWFILFRIDNSDGSALFAYVPKGLARNKLSGFRRLPT